MVSVVESTITFDTSEPSVPVTASCAPMTSLFRRLMSAPVCVRVKNATGMRCTLSNSATRRSWIIPSPMLDAPQRCTTPMNAVASAAATVIAVSHTARRRLPDGMAVSMIPRKSSGGRRPMREPTTMVAR